MKLLSFLFVITMEAQIKIFTNHHAICLSRHLFSPHGPDESLLMNVCYLFSV